MEYKIISSMKRKPTPLLTKLEALPAMAIIPTAFSAPRRYGVIPAPFLCNTPAPNSSTRILTASNDDRNKGSPPRRLGHRRRGGIHPKLM